MSGRLTLWGAGQMLRNYFGQTTEPPTSFYLALCRTIAPTAYVSGAELDEPPAESGYQRIQLPNDATSWADDSGLLHVVANQIEVSYVVALEDWGRIGYWALCNAEVEGYVLVVGELEEEQLILTGDQLVLGTDALTIELGPFFTDEDF